MGQHEKAADNLLVAQVRSLSHQLVSLGLRVEELARFQARFEGLTQELRSEDRLKLARLAEDIDELQQGQQRLEALAQRLSVQLAGLKASVPAQYGRQNPGNIVVGAPQHNKLEELTRLTEVEQLKQELARVREVLRERLYYTLYEGTARVCVCCGNREGFPNPDCDCGVLAE